MEKVGSIGSGSMVDGEGRVYWLRFYGRWRRVESVGSGSMVDGQAGWTSKPSHMHGMLQAKQI